MLCTARLMTFDVDCRLSLFLSCFVWGSISRECTTWYIKTTSNTFLFITDVSKSAFLINICGYRNIIPGHNFVALPCSSRSSRFFIHQVPLYLIYTSLRVLMIVLSIRLDFPSQYSTGYRNKRQVSIHCASIIKLNRLFIHCSYLKYLCSIKASTIVNTGRL